MNELRVGIIGVGSRGRTLARNMAEQYAKAKLRVVAVHDMNEHTMSTIAETVAGQFAENGAPESGVRSCADGQRLIQADDIDLVMVTTTSDGPAEYVLPALRTSKHVYCDKPLAHTVEDCVRMVEGADAAGKPVIMGFTRRYEAPWRKARELVAAGAIGELQMILVRDIIPYSRYFSGWWRKREWSGGALNDKGSHLFDVMNWFTGDLPLTAHAFGTRSISPVVAGTPSNCRLCERTCDYRQSPHDPEGFAASHELPKNYRDTCVLSGESDAYHAGSVHFRYPNDVIATYVYDFQGFKGDDQETMELIGRTGKIVLTRHVGTLEVVTDFGRAREMIDCRNSGFSGSHFGADAMLIHDLRRFCDGAQPPVSAREGLAATRMVWAALTSMDAGGRVVQLTELPDATPWKPEAAVWS